MWPKHWTPYGLMAFSASLFTLTFPFIWWKPFYPTFEVGRSKHSSIGYILSPWNVGWRGAGESNLHCPLQSICQWYAILSIYVELAIYAYDTAVVVTSRKTALLVRYLKFYLADLERWLKKWRLPQRIEEHPGVSRILAQFSSSGSPSYGSIQPVILG